MGKNIPTKEHLGKTFNRWTIIEILPIKEANKKCRRNVKVRCECGKESIVILNNIIRGLSKSCGCLNIENQAALHTTHGLSDSRVYAIYHHMLKRCSDKATPEDKVLYFDKGVRVCEEWKEDFMSFYNWAIAAEYQDNLTIDRYPDYNGNYEPANCRWATIKEQVRNREMTLTVVFKGEKRVLAELAESSGMTYHSLYKRLYIYNYTIERAISKPLRRRVVRNLT